MVERRLPCSKNNTSALVQLFAQRAGVAGSQANDAMSRLVARLREPSNQAGVPAELNHLLTKRRILETKIVRGLSSDGYIEPIGCTFDDGFRIVVRGGSAETRSRFTIAHELCHTFFYEIVPELKFGCQETDPEEERLCNLGASELLIPAKSLKIRTKKYRVSVTALEDLARMYIVSPAAMLLRLRSLRLWDCELSFWRPTQRGFLLDRMIGGRRANWVWPDDAALRRAWESNRTVSGRTYVELRDSGGGLQLRSVSFQVVKRCNSVMALWSAKPFESEPRRLPLFETKNIFRVEAKR
jgi:Zn-dependent peptidase ImmA (M78 family)